MSTLNTFGEKKKTQTNRKNEQLFQLTGTLRAVCSAMLILLISTL